MTREDYVWVGMRVFGIYLLVLAVTNLPGFITALYFASSMWGQGGFELREEALGELKVHRAHWYFD